MNWFLIVPSIGFLSGILFRSFWGDEFFAYLAFLFFFVIGLYALLLKRHERSSARGVFLFTLFLFGSGLGILRTERALITPVTFDISVEQRVLVEGVVTSEPEEKDESISLIVSPDVISGKKLLGKQPRILVRALLPAEFFYGDRISVSGVLEHPWEGEGNFNYPKFLAKDNVFYEIKNPAIEIKGRNQGNKIVQTLLSFKYAFLEKIERAVSEPAASLAAGVLLGIKGSLGENILNDLRTAGVIHIIVLSGFNITIIASIVIRLFGFFLSRRISLLSAITAIILFTIMVGAGATVVRASIMAIISLFAKLFYRQASVLQALILAGVGMTAVNPLIAAFDPSFQLSFLATLGLVILSPIVEKALTHLPIPGMLREIATATISAQIFVLPLLLYMMGELSLVSLPANIFILPVIPFLMLLGFLVGVFGFVHSLLALPFGILLSFLSRYVFSLSHFFGSVPTLHLPLNAVGLLIFYVVIAIGVWIIYKKPPFGAGKLTKLS